MSWLLRHNWPWSLVAFFLGAVITWLLLERRTPSEPDEVVEPDEVLETVEEKEEVLVGVQPEPAKPAAKPFSERMEPDPTLFDDIEAEAPKPQQPLQSKPHSEPAPGRFGPGSADAVPHRAPPDGYTIKGNAQSMLFHTPDSPYYGRTKPEVWFRTEADAERAGFTKYTRRPRKSADPRD